MSATAKLLTLETALTIPCCCRERDLVLQALDLCNFITHFDADFGFHHRLSTPGILPSSIRSLTLRNIDVKAIFPLLAELPCLRDLTLRLVL